MNNMNKKKILPYLLGGAVGALAGYLYFRFIGCRTGSCPLTSTLPGALIYGALLGGLVGGLLAPSRRRAKP